MSGEDTTEISANLTYRETEDLEFYLTGSFEFIRPESLNVLDPRVEAQFTTGMRYVFDSGWQWAAVGSFKGYVFKDLNADGVRQPEEAGIPDVRVSAAGKEAVTDDNGFYEIKSVSGKRVALEIDATNVPHGYAPTSSAEPAYDIAHRATRQVDFGFTPRSEVTGIVFHDVDGNGTYERTDRPVKKVRVLLEDGSKAFTNSIGVFSFPGAVAGEHTASLDLTTLPDGYLPLDLPQKKFTLFEGLRYELHFAVKAVRQVTGRVFKDANKNGAIDKGEEGVPGALVFLGDHSIKTDEEGWYLFDDVPPGVYDLAVDPQSLPSGYRSLEVVSVAMPDDPTVYANKHVPLVEN
jgi:hypothetical protein